MPAMQKLEEEIDTFDATREQEAEWLNQVEFQRIEQSDKRERLEAINAQMQGAIQAAEQRAETAEVQAGTAEQRAAAAEEAAAAARAAAEVQVRPHLLTRWDRVQHHHPPGHQDDPQGGSCRWSAWLQGAIGVGIRLFPTT